ncbi:hypothetical protein P4T18_07165, partial [Bacillus inaquosorum]|nr:hypothetical protein [Bacillus inaquosorum]
SKVLSSITRGTRYDSGDLSRDLTTSNEPRHDPYLYKPGNNN